MSEDKALASTTPGARLRAALTDDQIQVLLDVVAAAGHLQAADDELRAADPDLADTVRRILDEPRTQSGAEASSRKTVEIWNNLWESWADPVAEVGDEEGRYVNHEEHWHPPYFDPSALADDLEEAADKLAEWIDRAFSLVAEPDLFLESLEEINLNMQSFPEWFQPVDDDFVLGPRASSCVLRWTWLGLANQRKPGRKLVDLLCGMEVPRQHTELDRDACCQFLAGLPEGVCHEIHAYLREPQFAERLANLRSVWHRVQHEFEARFDPSAHLRTCEDHLGQDWRHGEPLIADAVSRQDLAAAERFTELTLSSLLRCSEEEPWRPEKLLLPQSRYYRSPEEGQAMLRLLDQWEETATRRGKQERVASLRLQRTVLNSPEDWTVVLEAFQEYQRHLANPKMAERLFAEWQQRIADACAQQELRNQKATDTWMHRLIHAQRDPSSSQKAFIEHVEVWLECCRDHVAFFQKNWQSLALLTRHLPRHVEIQARCPTFCSHVLVPALHVSEDMERSLRKALALLGEKADRIQVSPIWEQHLHTLVPSPGTGGSSYQDSARWMKALSEVKPSGYEHLLVRWKTEFRRRRNLWADMADAGCPGL